MMHCGIAGTLENHFRKTQREKPNTENGREVLRTRISSNLFPSLL